MQHDYSSGSINVLLSTNTAGIFFKILGSQPAVLSWDVDKKTVTITKTFRDGSPDEVVVTIPASQVQRAFFHNGSYIIRINHQAYHMDVQHYRNQGALANDFLNGETSDFAGLLRESKNQTPDLVKFLKASMPENMVYTSPITPKVHIKIVIAMLVLFALIVVGTVIAGALKA